MFFLSIENPYSMDYLADWLEFFILLNGEKVSKAEFSSYVASEYCEEREFEDESFMVLIDSVWIELNERKKLYGSNPPFIIEHSTIFPKIKFKDNIIYSTCLLLSLFGNNYKPQYTGKLFERLSELAIKNYLGGETIVYGHPSKQSVQNMANKIKESFLETMPSKFNDRGLDIIAWKSFEDRREGKIIILFQCASGNNWRDKLTTLSIKVWTSYINWTVNPLRGFILPKIVSNTEFKEKSREGGILIDRARIFKNVSIQDIQSELKEELNIWCENKIKECDENEIY